MPMTPREMIAHLKKSGFVVLIDTRVNTYYNLIKVKTLIVSYEG